MIAALVVLLLVAGGTPPGACDFDKDGFTTVVDLQRLINRRLAGQSTGKCKLAAVSNSVAWISKILVRWEPAAGENLEYLVCYSPRDDLSTVADCEAAVAMDWTEGVTRFWMRRPQPGAYFFRVLVRNAEGDKWMHEARADWVAPPRPLGP